MRFPITAGKQCCGTSTVKLEKEPYLYPACGGHSLQNGTNDNGKRLVNVALGRDLTVTGTWCQRTDIHKLTLISADNRMCIHIDLILVDRRRCTNLYDVRSTRVAEMQSDSSLVRAKTRLKIEGSEKTKKSEIMKWDNGKINKKYVKEEFIKEVTANVQNIQLEEVEDIN